MMQQQQQYPQQNMQMQMPQNNNMMQQPQMMMGYPNPNGQPQMMQHNNMQMNMNMNMNMNQRGYGYGGTEQIVYAYDGRCQDVQGVINLILQPGKKFDHNGIKVQFLGRIDMVSANYLWLLLNINIHSIHVMCAELW